MVFFWYFISNVLLYDAFAKELHKVFDGTPPKRKPFLALYEMDQGNHPAGEL